MSNWMKYGTITLILVVFVLLFFWIGADVKEEEQAVDEKTEQEGGDNKHNEFNPNNRRPIPINPDGMFLIHHLFKSYDKAKKMKPMRSPIAANLPKKSTNAFPNIYIVLGDGSYLDYEDADELLAFVELGNVAFICANDIGYSLKNQLFWGDEYANQFDKCMNVNFLNDSLLLPASYHWLYESNNGESYEDYWHFWNIESLKYNDYAVVSAATMCDDNSGKAHPICIRINIGEGQLFLHTEPLMFINRILMGDNQSLAYAERVFSHLPRGNVYWHELNGRNSRKYLAEKGNEESAQGEGGGSGSYGKRRDSPLQFILSANSLKWALYLLLTGLIFYILFQSKRRRKIVSVAEKRTNSTVEFADTVSQLYYQERRHDKLIRHQEVLFLDFIRSKYYLNTTNPDHQFIEGLSKKSGIDEKQLEQIFTAFRYAKKNDNINDSFLIKLHENLDNFYKNCN